MKRILLTGMSGTGKSTLTAELTRRGYKAVDADSDEWSDWVSYTPHPDVSEPDAPEKEWVWRADRIRDLLETEAADTLFVSGCSSNMAQFYDQFDHIVLLSAPTDVIVERLASRTTNSFGKRPEELAQVLHHIATVEPLLRKGATHEIDTSRSLDEAIDQLFHLI